MLQLHSWVKSHSSNPLNLRSCYSAVQYIHSALYSIVLRKWRVIHVTALDQLSAISLQIKQDLYQNREIEIYHSLTLVALFGPYFSLACSILVGATPVRLAPLIPIPSKSPVVPWQGRPSSSFSVLRTV